MPRWQRRVRLLLATFIVVLSTVVFVSLRSRPTVAPPTVSESIDPRVVVDSRGTEVVRLRLARQDVKIEARRTLTYADGTNRLQDVSVTVNERAGRTFLIKSREGDVAPNQNSFRVAGSVRLEASDGLRVQGESAFYETEPGLLRIDGPLSFERPGLSGSAVGATYDHSRDLLWLLDRAHVTLAAEGESLPVVAVAGAAALARREGSVRFERGARLERGGRALQADTIMAYAATGTERLDRLELRGGARLGRPQSAPDSVGEMRADDINLTYGPDGRTLSRALLSGHAAIRLSANSGPMIAAGWIEPAFGPDGLGVQTLTARDEVDLTFPAAEREPPRRVRAATLDGRSSTGAELNLFRLAGGVEFREEPVPAGPSSSARVVRSPRLDLAVDEHQQLESATFAGGSRLQDADVTASADTMRYLVARGVFELESPNPASARPRVADSQSNTEASAISITLADRRISGRGSVRSEIRPSDGGARSTTRVPGMLKAAVPVFITAEQVESTDEGTRAAYAGGVRLFQDETVIQADRLLLDSRTGDLVATTGVRSRLAMEEVNQQTGARERITQSGTAATLRYEEAERRLVYETRAGLQGPQGRLDADRIELHLDRTGRTVERVEGYGTVKVQVDGRVATGGRLTYVAAEERYRMTGSPVHMLVENCRETTGGTLTFYRSTDTITVDGHDRRTRTLKKTGVNCPEPLVR